MTISFRWPSDHHCLLLPFNSSLLFSPHAPNSNLQHFAAVLPSCAEVNPPTLRCCFPLTRRSQPSNTSLLFSPHAPKSTLQQFAAVLPSCAEVNPSTVRCCSPLTPRTHPSTIHLLLSPHPRK